MLIKAKTIKEYLAKVPSERRAAIESVRKVIRNNIPTGYKETLQYGMISYVVPLSLYPRGYLDQEDVPLPHIGLASQKNNMAVYLMDIYQDKQTAKWFVTEYKKIGKKMDTGKSCVRFKKLDDLPLELIGKAAALTSVPKTIQAYEKAKLRRKK